MRITSKGQVTIPAAIRERAGLMPNTEVEFTLEGDVAQMRAATGKSKRPTRGERLVEHMQRHPGKGDMTTDEIMRLMRGDEWPDLR
ncbi:MAG: AbrB/MazE/SpoVT family DNA-binding domain-containing protein [Methylobacteriaceae bacterium]|nr:AbrB/MazE/SpoVT family DNA-binding domain-containing protein [Methylobacteriaceae bacterium]MBV9635118.1 AbrB/MazE/SpoVT family DNA-binding domain-containing protein [Methylobacteriaceae bacterium]MBV9703597.1 AbrB/MazE/SpoVT family DNA-binding domain-containing protein [Methylobacteriaceae bacterium]